MMMVVAVAKKLNITRSNQRSCDMLTAVTYLWWLMTVVLCLVNLVTGASSAHPDHSVSRVNVSGSCGDTCRPLAPADNLKRRCKLVASPVVQAPAKSGSARWGRPGHEAVGQCDDGRPVRWGCSFNPCWLRNGPFRTTHGAPGVIEALPQPTTFDPRLHLIHCLAATEPYKWSIPKVELARCRSSDADTILADNHTFTWGLRQETAIIAFVVDEGARGLDQGFEVSSNLNPIPMSQVPQAASLGLGHMVTEASNFVTYVADTRRAGIADSSDGPPTKGVVYPDVVTWGANLQNAALPAAEWPRTDRSTTPSFPENSERYLESSGSHPAVVAVVRRTAPVRQWFSNSADPSYHSPTPLVTTNTCLINWSWRLRPLGGSDPGLLNQPIGDERDSDPIPAESPHILTEDSILLISHSDPIPAESPPLLFAQPRRLSQLRNILSNQGVSITKPSRSNRERWPHQATRNLIGTQVYLTHN